MPSTETDKSPTNPINQEAIHVSGKDFAKLIAEGEDTITNQRFTVHLDSETDSPAAGEEDTVESESYGQRVAIINYASVPLEAIVTGEKPDPNRPGFKLFTVEPADPGDIEDFPKVVPQEFLVPSRVQVEQVGKNLAEALKMPTVIEADTEAKLQHEQEQSIREARADTEAAYAAIESQSETALTEEVGNEGQSEVDIATKALDTLEIGLSGGDIIALKQYAIGKLANKPHEQTAAEKKMSSVIINNNNLKTNYSEAWARLMDARKASES